MNLIVTVMLLGVASVADATGADSWVKDPPKNLQLTYAMPELDSPQYFEVPISLADEAIKVLETTPIVELQENQSQHFGKSCVMPMHAYLVRAVFEHAGNGTFHVKQLQGAMWVIHYAFGPRAPKHRSALVVCTEIQPTSIYVSAGGAL